MKSPRESSAWISTALGAARQWELHDSLATILPGEFEQHQRFVQAANKAIDIFSKLSKPGVGEVAKSRDRVAILGKVARAFSKALNAPGD